MREHGGQDADVRLVIALDAVVGIDAAVAQSAFPEERRAVEGFDVHFGVSRQGHAVGVRRVDRSFAKTEILAADEEIADEMHAEDVRFAAETLDAEILQQFRCKGRIAFLLDLLQDEQRAA